MASRNSGVLPYIFPFSQGPRDFVVAADSVFVIQAGEVMQSHPTDAAQFQSVELDYLEVEVYNKWVNFKGADGYFLTYSTKDNRFIKLK